MKFIVTIVLMLLVPPTARAQESMNLYAVNQSASSIGFTIFGSMLFKIRRDGRFKDFSGELAYDPGRPADTHVDLTVYTSSVDMHNASQDQLLKSEEFFDVARYPTMRFTSTSAEAKSAGELAITGDMTIRGVTRPMTILVKMHTPGAVGSPAPAVFETTFPIDRTDFGLNGNPGWGGFTLKIAKNVEIHLSIATVALTGRPFSNP